MPISLPPRVLTLLVHGQHKGPVLWVKVKEDGGANQVLGKVAKQGGSPETDEHLVILPAMPFLMGTGK